MSRGGDTVESASESDSFAASSKTRVNRGIGMSGEALTCASDWEVYGFY